MEIDKFASDAPGELVAIDGSDYAFVPQPFPPSWEFPERLWPLLSEAKHRVGMLEGLGRNLPNPLLLLAPLENREAIRSSRLEGTYATPKELLLFELDPKEPQSEDDPANSRREVFNYRQAILEGQQSELPLSLRLIRNLHAILLDRVRGEDRAPGQFRSVQVYIGSSKRFIPPPANRLMECLDRLEKYLHHTDKQFDPLVDCFLVHYQFEAIHPFVDGNGRIGRLLLALMLQQRCGFSKPWLYMSAYFEEYRDEYSDRLLNISTQGDWASWIEFCLHGTVVQAEDAIHRCERLLALRSEFDRRLTQTRGSVRLGRIVEKLFYSPFVRVVDLERELDVTYPTARSDVDRLVEAGMLQELEGLTPKTFYSPEVFDVAYEDSPESDAGGA